MKIAHLLFLSIILAGSATAGQTDKPPTAATRPRQSAPDLRATLQLDGIWQVGEGTADAPPASFDRTMQVPGLVAHAEPAFEADGMASRRQTTFWLRRAFTLPEPLATVAVLRIGQALYGFKVRINGASAAENTSGQAPSSIDVRRFLKPGLNEICIAVNTMPGFSPEGKRDWGEEHGNIVPPPKVPVGWDFEKDNFIPGITDSVELVTAETPFVRLTQVVPDIQKPAATVHVWLQGVPAGKSPVSVTVSEWMSGNAVGETLVHAEGDAQGNAHVIVRVDLPNGKLWSPESPFLYTARVTTANDSHTTRFGLRTFTFDPQSRRAILNGKPYFMRGTNYCLQRFMDDPKICQHLPWDKSWVRGLHQKGKSMQWNTIRYCIGLMPQFWYDIADEVGFLIQDEYPLWTLELPLENSINGSVEALAKDYRAMLEAHWNHPSVVIWDACNESQHRESGEAIKRVRDLDLSNRPWDNGWNQPQRPTDSVEAHPYYFSEAKGHAWLSGLETANRNADPGRANMKAPPCVIVNEYGWLWINRDGSPTTLTYPIFKRILGHANSASNNRHLYALFQAAETEFWRHARSAAAVMEFCSLGYCHLGVGMTSDHFLENGGVKNLELEPEFLKYVGDAFAPVGVMIQYWKPEMTAGQTLPLSISLINDLEKPWSGRVSLRFIREGKTVAEFTKPAELPPQGAVLVAFDAVAVPATAGDYQLVAAINGADDKPVQSVREIKIIAAQTNP
jgi:beta-galactosidase